MNFKEKTELARLLAIYQNDQIEKQRENEINLKEVRKNGKSRWEADVISAGFIFYFLLFYFC